MSRDERGRVARSLERVAAFLLPVVHDRRDFEGVAARVNAATWRTTSDGSRSSNTRGSLAVRGGGGFFGCSQTDAHYTCGSRARTRRPALAIFSARRRQNSFGERRT